jgi:hypothetical protein
VPPGIDQSRTGTGELFALNVLLLPDEHTVELVGEVNARLRHDVPAGFAFDETHLPHVTLLQRYVRRGDLERVLEKTGAVAELQVAPLDPGAAAKHLRLRADGLGGGELGTPPGTVLASLEFELQLAVSALHETFLRALGPLAAAGGSAEAFFRLPGEPPPNAATVAYVESFVPAHSGEHYAPHLTVGVARERSLRGLARDHRLGSARITPVAVAVAHLGDLGTARRVFWRWPLG